MKQPVAMPQVPWFLLSSALVIVSTAAISGAAASSPALPSAALSLPGCLSKCGSIDIPYPFGIGDECAWPGGGNFNITCDRSYSPPIPYTGNIPIANISVETGEMHVYTSAGVASVCYNSTNTIDYDKTTFNVTWDLDQTFRISPTRNIFTAIGCDAVGVLQAGSDWSYYTGCISYCTSWNNSAQDEDPCTGLGCCQTSSIPANLTNIYIEYIGWEDADDNKTVKNSAWPYSPCKHAMVAEKDSYKFRRQHLKDNGADIFSNTPVVLDWAIRGNGSCPKMQGTSGVQPAPACASAHSYCEDLSDTQGGGYLCKCSKGYMGNPYIHDGCTNINECTDPRYANITANGPCGMYTTCKDTDGDYLCECNNNRKGDGKSQKGCYQYKFPPYAMAAVATIIATVLANFAVILLQRRNQRMLFDKNGGKILAANGITIYTKREVHKITKGYSKRLGGGNFGDVYQGSIGGSQAQPVAVKCSVATRVARRWRKTTQHVALQPEQEENGFVNEIMFQFKIRHTNVVRLIGCCLETNIPILVFELVSNGSLHDALHGANNKQYALSLLKRLDIAIGSAEALNHMHSLGDHVHGDMKPANILLDKDMKPKVSDFGSSKLLSVDRYARAVAADRVYIDPVYMKTSRFTVKSDVYSFGIVLLELITRKTEKYNENRSLSLDFIRCFKDNGSGRAMYDSEIFLCEDAQTPNGMVCLDRIGMLAVRCLKEDVDERPTMAEVVVELKQVNVMACGGSASAEAT